ncbi:exodeoxyribonuclease V subunit alpha [Desulfobulbus sp. TB]|nr:exodeoxyribonuclease V subunit alpha [Desulfobulbus sp. TB]
MHNQLQQACDAGAIRPLDLHLGLFLEKQAVSRVRTISTERQQRHPPLLLAATLASAAVGNGHICFPLEEATGEQISEQPVIADLVKEYCPNPKYWREELLATSVVGNPGEDSPLILDKKNHLYLYRFLCYEEFIAKTLRHRAATQLTCDHQLAAQLLRQLFPSTEQGEGGRINFQQIAAALALLKPLLIISGGPGTGKTHTVARILAVIQALHAQQQQGQRKKILKVALAAPTGKAAARLEESLRQAKLSLSEEFCRNIPEQAQTLHRLLGSRPGAATFRFNRENPIYLDLLILDEASMIDVEMMVSILEALPEKTRIILLGDRNQLASVEAGSLFADLCGHDEPQWSSQLCTQLEQLCNSPGVLSSSSAQVAYATGQATEQAGVSPLADSLVVLRTSYRFQNNSGIGALASAVKKCSVEQVQQVITAHFTDVEAVQYTGKKRKQWLEEQIIQGFQPMLTASTPEQAFAAMEGFRLLCALRKGPDGVQGINTLVTQVLRQAGLITLQNTEWYHGRPIIILRNQYEMQLFNGDTGILWQDEKGLLRAWFRRSDNSLTSMSCARLPEHETAYAITIHKAQGSEFEQVLLVLPEEESQILTQELLYTGITRAKNKLILCASLARIATTVQKKTQRFSGLAEKLHDLKNIT